MKIQFTTPATFWDDHVSRSNDPYALRDAEIKTDRKGVTLALTEDQLSELESDAEFYAYMGVSEFGFEYAGLISSARATVKRIKKMREASA